MQWSRRAWHLRWGFLLISHQGYPRMMTHTSLCNVGVKLQPWDSHRCNMAFTGKIPCVFNNLNCLALKPLSFLQPMAELTNKNDSGAVTWLWRHKVSYDLAWNTAVAFSTTSKQICASSFAPWLSTFFAQTCKTMQGICKVQTSLDHHFIHRCMLLGNEKFLNEWNGFEIAEVKREHELQIDLVVLGSTHYNSHNQKYIIHNSLHTKTPRCSGLGPKP